MKERKCKNCIHFNKEENTDFGYCNRLDFGFDYDTVSDIVIFNPVEENISSSFFVSKDFGCIYFKESNLEIIYDRKFNLSDDPDF